MTALGLVWLWWLLADFGVYVSMPSLLSILVLMSVTHEHEHTLNSVCLIHLEFEGVLDVYVDMSLCISL